MRKLTYVILPIIFMFLFSVCVNAEASNFEPFIEMYSDITENQIRLKLGFSGEEVMTIKQTISYDPEKLTLVSVDEMDNFNVTTSLEEDNDRYRTINILVDSDYSFNDSYYAIVVFEVSPSFKNNKKSDVFFYDYTASGPEKVKFRYSGLIATLNRVSASEMNYVIDFITNSTKTKYWLINHIYLFVLAFLGIVAIVVIILLLPSTRKKEVRDKTVENNIKAENYDPNSSNIKIDQKAIDSIGKVEKTIDMSQAIIVNEDVKPFGDIVGKFEDSQVIEPKQEIQEDNNINIFEQRKPEDFDTVEVKEEKQEIQMPNNLTTANGVAESLSKVHEENSNLTVIQPQTFEEVEMPKLSEVKIDEPSKGEDTDYEVLDTNSNDNNNSNNSFLTSILFLLMISLSLISITNVNASNYRVDDLRNYLVGRGSYDKDLDYNNDGVIDVLDMIETKDLTNCNFDNLLSSDPGFADIHGQSNNLISTDSNFVRPTKNSNKKSTTKKVTTKRTTKNNNSNSSSSNGSKTTTSKTTKSTTVKSITTKTTTTKKTTTKKSTTTKTTTTKTTQPTYQVNIQATNGSVSSSSFTLQGGKSKTLTLTGNDGYVIDTNNSTCTNISYSFSSTSKLVLSNPVGNATCSLKFIPKGNIKVTLRVHTGVGNSTKATPSVNDTSYKSVDNGGNGTYNNVWSTGVTLPTGYEVHGNPSCGSYNNEVFSINIPSSNNTICHLYFYPILYEFTLNVGGQKVNTMPGAYQNIFFNEQETFEFPSNLDYTKVSCTGGQTPKLTKKNSSSGATKYEYSFAYKHTTASNATCNVS